MAATSASALMFTNSWPCIGQAAPLGEDDFHAQQFELGQPRLGRGKCKQRLRAVEQGAGRSANRGFMARTVPLRRSTMGWKKGEIAGGEAGVALGRVCRGMLWKLFVGGDRAREKRA